MIGTNQSISRLAMSFIVYGIVLLFFLGPSSWLILTSLDSSPNYSWSIPDEITLTNYLELFSQDDIRLWIRNSFLLGGGTGVLTVFLSTLAAYPLSRFDFRWKTLFMYLILVSRIMPITAVIIPIFSIAVMLDMINTFWGVILILTAMQLPIGLWIMKDFMDKIPLEIEEAAWLDGCGRFNGIRYIVFPLMGPPIAVVGLLSFLAGWGDFLIPLILLRSPDRFPISMGLFRAFNDMGNVDFGYLTAISVIYSLPSLVMYLFARKFLMKGIVSGQ